LTWTVNQADGFELGFENAHHLLKAGLHEAVHTIAHPAPGKAALNFEQSFVSQLSNVIGAMGNTEALLVPATEAIAAVRLLEHCYRHRRLMPMPWLSQSELLSAKELNQRQQQHMLFIPEDLESSPAQALANMATEVGQP
jgi:hypothetical protein